MEHQNPDIGGTSNNDNEEDNKNNSKTNNDQSDNQERSEEEQESDEDDNDNDNENDENDYSPQLESSVELYKKLNFPKCSKNDESFFGKNGEYTHDSDEHSQYGENGITKFKQTDSSEVYYKCTILVSTFVD